MRPPHSNTSSPDYELVKLVLKPPLRIIGITAQMKKKQVGFLRTMEVMLTLLGFLAIWLALLPIKVYLAIAAVALLTKNRLEWAGQALVISS